MIFPLGLDSSASAYKNIKDLFKKLLYIKFSFFNSFLFLKKKDVLFIFLIYFWLCRFLVAARGIFVEACAIFRCGMRACHCFSLVVALRLHGAWALQLWRMGSRARGLCSLRHAGSLVEARELSSCGTWAQLPHSMWDLSSLTRDRTCVPCIVRWILYRWTPREVP